MKSLRSLPSAHSASGPTAFLEQLDVGGCADDWATRDFHFLLRYRGDGDALEPLDEGPARVGLEHHPPGEGAADVFLDDRIALVAQELAHELYVLGADIGERTADQAAAEHLDLEIGFASGAVSQHLVDELLHGEGSVARRSTVAIASRARGLGEEKMVHAAHEGDGVAYASRNAAAQDRRVGEVAVVR